MEFTVSTTDRTEAVDVTSRVEEAVPDALTAGTCTVFVQHTTAAVVVQEAGSGLLGDIESFVDELVPGDGGYSHDRIDDNAPAHLRATLLGESVTLPVEAGSLALGTWQSVLLVELDGPRERRMRVVVSEAVEP